MQVWRNRLSGAGAQVAVKALALVGALGLKLATCQPDDLDCLRATREGDDGLAVLVCQQEYARTRDPGTGAKLANYLRRSGDRQGASALATGLLATPARSDALQVLGKIAVSENRLDAGRTLLANARQLHSAEQRPKETALDDQALAGIFREQKQFAEALLALDACIAEAREADDHVTEGYCHVSAAMMLGEVGYFEAAHEELELAEPLFTMARDMAELAIQRGRLDLRYGLGPGDRRHNAEALIEFERGVQLASAAKLLTAQRRAELNLVFALAELNRTDEATRHLETARLLDVDKIDDDDRALLEARIAFHRGDFALATSINTRMYDQPEADLDDRLRLSVMQAQIGRATGNLEDTIRWAERGVEIAEAMRSAQSAIELRSWALSMRRVPHELLFAALARAQRFEDALVGFDRWQGRTLQDAIARGKTKQPPTLRAAAIQTEELHRLVPVLSSAPIMKPVGRATLLEALGGVELVALLAADGEIWRITAQHGRFDVEDLGALDKLQPELAAFKAQPTRAERGEALGARLLGDTMFRDTRETLFVLLDGEVANLPVAALRSRGRPLVAMRPVVRVPRMSELGCAPRAAARRAVIVGDARGDLPAARREAEEIAAPLGVTARVGSAATSAALFTASGADFLHVAVHANVELGGGSLDMYDRPVSALELATRKAAPALVMLSSCASAVADDGELGAAVGAAVLARGSAQVIGTLRPIDDDGARELTRAFYRGGGIADPVSVLARVQSALAQTPNLDWPNFVLFGHDTCPKELP